MSSDYQAYGGAIEDRQFMSETYRYGFNGKEKDDEGMGGGGSTYDYGFRIYNPQIGKFLSVDPWEENKTPEARLNYQYNSSHTKFSHGTTVYFDECYFIYKSAGDPTSKFYFTVRYHPVKTSLDSIYKIVDTWSSLYDYSAVTKPLGSDTTKWYYFASPPK